MIETDYPIGALALLLREDCLPERYHPLISRREELIAGLRRLGCRRKNEAAGSDPAVFISAPRICASHTDGIKIYDILVLAVSSICLILQV